MIGDLLPENQEQARFRYLGRIAENGKPALVVAFIEKDGTREGLVWLDEATKRIIRIRTDTLDRHDGGKFDSFTRDVRFAPVDFSAPAVTLWLPSIATVHARFAAGELHTVHRFADYHAAESNAAGSTAELTGREEDAFEVLLNGIKALDEGKPGDAVFVLREAAKHLPERIEPSFYLGIALLRTHELAGAETQFRETVKRSPNLAVAHNELGAVLFERRDKPGAMAEFQEALRLDPGNAGMRANLDAATGDTVSSAG
jgi:Flp pilus assembly protein TadD